MKYSPEEDEIQPGGGRNTARKRMKYSPEEDEIQPGGGRKAEGS